MNTTNTTHPPPPSQQWAAGFAIALLAVTLTLNWDSAQAQAIDFQKVIATNAVAKSEAQAESDWGPAVCIDVTRNGDGTTGVAQVWYETRVFSNGVRQQGERMTIAAWSIGKDTAGYPGNRYQDFNGNATNVFRGVTVQDGEDHLGNEYWKSTAATHSSGGTFNAMFPKFYVKDGSSVWVEIDTPDIKINQYQDVKKVTTLSAQCREP